MFVFNIMRLLNNLTVSTQIQIFNNIFVNDKIDYQEFYNDNVTFRYGILIPKISQKYNKK